MKKRVLSVLFIAMMIACSSDDSSNVEDEVEKEMVLQSEKNDFEVIYTQYFSPQ